MGLFDSRGKEPPAQEVEELIAGLTNETIAVVEELRPAPTPEQVFSSLACQPHCLFLDSALAKSELGRYSFVTCDPFDFLEVSADDSTALTQLDKKLAEFSIETIAGLPPFQGGAAGLLSYDLCHSLECVPRPRYDEFQVPALSFGFYDTVVAFDHHTDQAWIVSQGLPELESTNRNRRARERILRFRKLIDGSSIQNFAKQIDNRHVVTDLAPQFAVGQGSELTSDFGADDFRRAIQTVIDYIHAGDVFQVNLSHRLLHKATCPSPELYLRLRRNNPAPFASYFDLGDFQIVSASPERFISVRDGFVEARPIKGTRQVIQRPEADLFAGDDLRQSEKDRAENVMITDLLRNDISRVCDRESVHVTELCRLEVYEFVQHLVSVVRGKLSDGKTPLDLIRAAFPGGSITGAPKIRAMEIISELEPTARGAYCGSLGYIGFDGTVDLSILIRCITAGRGWWQLPVGGGIVAQSNPQSEHEETWHKAKGLIRAVQSI